MYEVNNLTNTISIDVCYTPYDFYESKIDIEIGTSPCRISSKSLK
jgi:hypothetical protein